MHASVRVGEDGGAEVNASYTTDSCVTFARVVKSYNVIRLEKE